MQRVQVLRGWQSLKGSLKNVAIGHSVSLVSRKPPILLKMAATLWYDFSQVSQLFITLICKMEITLPL